MASTKKTYCSSLCSLAPPAGQVEPRPLLPVLLQQEAEVVELMNAGGQPEGHTEEVRTPQDNTNAPLPAAASVPAEGVQQGHDLLPGQLESFGGAVFRKVLDLPLREEDLQSRPQTLRLPQDTRSDAQLCCDWLLRGGHTAANHSPVGGRFRTHLQFPPQATFAAADAVHDPGDVLEVEAELLLKETDAAFRPVSGGPKPRVQVLDLPSGFWLPSCVRRTWTSRQSAWGKLWKRRGAVSRPRC